MNLVDRVKNILLQPKEEWLAIDRESHTVQGLYTGYVLILAAIPVLGETYMYFRYHRRGRLPHH